LVIYMEVAQTRQTTKACMGNVAERDTSVGNARQVRTDTIAPEAREMEIEDNNRWLLDNTSDRLLNQKTGQIYIKKTGRPTRYATSIQAMGGKRQEFPWRAEGKCHSTTKWGRTSRGNRLGIVGSGHQKYQAFLNAVAHEALKRILLGWFVRKEDWTSIF
jgi:hypothetical protein